MREELIQKFFRKECTVEEAAMVVAFLENNPEILNEYVNKKEWDDAEAGSGMPEEFWQNVWEKIKKKKKTNATFILIKRFSIAASVGAIIVLGYYNINSNSNAIAEQNTRSIVADINHKTVANTTIAMQQIILPDSSIVELSKDAIIKYDIPFQNNKREITLAGEAYFKVAKDKTKPFIVYAAGFSTTALGTEFRVTTANAAKNIRVQLYKGKVVIRSVNNEMRGWNKDIYLLPGEQLQYDRNKMLASVEKINEIKNVPLTNELKRSNINKKHLNEPSDELQFNGTALPEVMNRLSKYFNVNIAYDKAEIESMSFTGTITKKDSVAIILKVITQMNELEISSNDSGYIIKKNLPQQ
jgi:transmembrane sensor